MIKKANVIKKNNINGLTFVKKKKQGIKANDIPGLSPS